jgi:predicted transcriptional regulator
VSFKHPCEIVTRHYLPAFRSLIAKGLVNDHRFTQIIAAKKLGTTQAAISYYLSSKRGEKYVEQLKNNPQAMLTITETINELSTGTLSTEALVSKFCGLCTSLRNHNLIDISV